MLICIFVDLQICLFADLLIRRLVDLQISLFADLQIRRFAVLLEAWLLGCFVALFMCGGMVAGGRWLLC